MERKIHGLLNNCLDSGPIGPLSNSAQVPLCKSPVSFEVRVAEGQVAEGQTFILGWSLLLLWF